MEALFLSLKNVIKNEVRSGEKHLSAKKVFVLSPILGDGRKIEQKHPEELQIILCNMFFGEICAYEVRDGQLHCQIERSANLHKCLAERTIFSCTIYSLTKETFSFIAVKLFLASLLLNLYGSQPRAIALINIKTQQNAARSRAELEIRKRAFVRRICFRCQVSRHLSGLQEKKSSIFSFFYFSNKANIKGIHAPFSKPSVRCYARFGKLR